jgi:hypothetical protein
MQFLSLPSLKVIILESIDIVSKSVVVSSKMREKVERDAPQKVGAAIRLTEYDPERNDGFVNRLNKETISFYFTNFPEDTPVMELWKLFAMYGHVGEVYIPKKMDKRGNKFGFVKYKEVKEVEELSNKLESVWMVTTKSK